MVVLDVDVVEVVLGLRKEPEMQSSPADLETGAQLWDFLADSAHLQLRDAHRPGRATHVDNETPEPGEEPKEAEPEPDQLACFQSWLHPRLEAVTHEQRVAMEEAQRASNVRKISERNCIDLVQKLILTNQEIRDCLEACGGRISVTELPNEVGISLEHIEARVEALRKRDGSLHKLNNDLFSQQYLQTLAQEIEEQLEESSGASGFRAYIRSSVLVLLTSRGTTVRQNTVHTSSYGARLEARVQGCLRGCLRPVILSQLAARHGFDGDLLANTVQKLIRDEVVVGKLHGGAFTPKAYTDAEAKKVDSFFESNGFLTAALVKASNLTLKEWVAQRKAEGYALLTSFVSSHLVDYVQATVAEALTADSWIDVQPLLPPTLAASEAGELLLQLKSQKKLPNSTVLLEHVAASAGFLEGIAKALEAETQKAAEKLVEAEVQKAAEKSAKPRAKREEEEEDSKKRPSKKGRKKKGQDEDLPEEGPRGESGVSNDAILDHLAETQLNEGFCEILCLVTSEQ
eukprot:g21684.t1